MKRNITWVLTILLVTVCASIAAPDKEAIKVKETAAWQTFKDKNADDFKKLIDKDFRGVYGDGIKNLQEQLDDMKRWDLKSFAFSDYTAFSDEPDVIVTTYTVKIEGTFDGKDASGTYNSGSVWKKEGNDWLAIFHTNIKQETAAK